MGTHSVRGSPLMGAVVWSVREGGIGDFDGPEIASGYQLDDPGREPQIHDVIYLAGEAWRVVDYQRTDIYREKSNRLVVKRFNADS